MSQGGVADSDDTMPRYRLTIEYDGTEFAGWQLQATDRTVQGTLEEAIQKVTGESVRVHAAGRTDAGVHALGQVCHLDLDSDLRAAEIRKALNAVLPEDASVRDVRSVPPDFDARRDALRKRYVYRILNRAAPSPLRRRFTWHIRSPLDLERMRRAAVPLLGEADFAAFRGTPGGAPGKESTIRTLEALQVLVEADEVRIIAEGRSFLRYMVRNLVGTLAQVGRRQRDPEGVASLLSSQDRAQAGPTAPPHGLCLTRILYPGDLSG